MRTVAFWRELLRLARGRGAKRLAVPQSPPSDLFPCQTSVLPRPSLVAVSCLGEHSRQSPTCGWGERGDALVYNTLGWILDLRKCSRLLRTRVIPSTSDQLGRPGCQIRELFPRGRRERPKERKRKQGLALSNGPTLTVPGQMQRTAYSRAWLPVQSTTVYNVGCCASFTQRDLASWCSGGGTAHGRRASFEAD